MHVELDLSGLTVLVVGRADRTRRARARYAAAGDGAASDAEAVVEATPKRRRAA